MNDVRKYYNKHHDEEDQRLSYHVFELPLTIRFIRRYLPEQSMIFDTACGTGRYAGEFLDDNMLLGLNDLSDQEIDLVRERYGDHQNVLFIDQGDILESKRWHEYKWDAVLILGPLYHLVSREQRLKLLRKAASAVKKDGLVFSSFMTRTGALIYGIKNNPNGIRYPDGAEKLWEDGTDTRFIEETEEFTNAYFSHPDEIEPLLKEAGLESLHLAGAEGVFGERFELFHSLKEDLQHAWMEFIFKHCEENEMICHSKHILSIARPA